MAVFKIDVPEPEDKFEESLEDNKSVTKLQEQSKVNLSEGMNENPEEKNTADELALLNLNCVVFVVFVTSPFVSTSSLVVVVKEIEGKLKYAPKFKVNGFLNL